MLSEIMIQNRAVHPLVHCITNYVSANDCANLLLACGASPIMADDPDEASEITGAAAGLVLNLGTPNPRKLDAMFIAGRQANRLGRPIVLDPVGAGCSNLRLDAAKSLIGELRIAAIRGNAAEIAALVQGSASCCGVDDDGRRTFTDAAATAKWLARETGAVVILTGENDIVTDGARLFCVRNGHAMMHLVTGAGCQLTALVGAYVSSNPDKTLISALAAVCAMGLCGEIAYERLGPADGNASYRNFIIDAVCRLEADALEKGAKYEAYE